MKTFFFIHMYTGVRGKDPLWLGITIECHLGSFPLEHKLGQGCLYKTRSRPCLPDPPLRVTKVIQVKDKV